MDQVAHWAERQRRHSIIAVFCWRVKSSFKLVWKKESTCTSPCNSLIGYSLNWLALLLIGLTKISVIESPLRLRALPCLFVSVEILHCIDVQVCVLNMCANTVLYMRLSTFRRRKKGGNWWWEPSPYQHQTGSFSVFFFSLKVPTNHASNKSE
jgi:hypothetical protein